MLLLTIRKTNKYMDRRIIIENMKKVTTMLFITVLKK